MFDINGWEFVILAIVALLVLGPDKLPGYAADARRMLRQLRRMADDARDEVTRELGPEFKDISLSDLNPRTFVARHLFDDDDDDDDPGGRGARNGGRSADDVGADAGRDKPRDKPQSGRMASGSTAFVPPEPEPRAVPPWDADAT